MRLQGTKIKKELAASIILSLTVLIFPAFSLAQNVETTGAVAQSHFAPGDFLPISVKLLNFGSDRRVDVSITYRVLDLFDNEVVNSVETVAVETTASFIKLLQLPKSLQPGHYVASASILYSGQEFPATAQFEFLVRRKFAGYFLSEWLIYGAIIVFLGLLAFLFGRSIFRKKVSAYSGSLDYSGVPKNDRVFYEIISDVIGQMRYRVGDRALEIARDIEGLEINEDTGQILKITKNPAKIVAILILKYENELGEKVSFALRQIEDKSGADVKSLDKNLVVIRKYFE